MFRFVVWVLGGWGKFRHVILASAKLLRLPRVWECLGVQLGVAEHFAEPGVVVGAVHVGVNVVRKGALVRGSGRGIFFRCGGRGACRGCTCWLGLGSLGVLPRGWWG